MKTIFTPKRKAITVIIGISSGVLLAFQNFTPHVSQQPSDVSDLYMNSALSTALKTKEDKKSKEVASNSDTTWSDDSTDSTLTKEREPAHDEPTTIDE